MNIAEIESRIKEMVVERLFLKVAPEELASALALPCAVPVTLGPRVLRVETAAVFGLSATFALAAGAR